MSEKVIIDPLMDYGGLLGTRELIVRIKNNDEREFPRDRLYFERNNFFAPSNCEVPSIRPNQEVHVIVDASPDGNRDVSHIDTTRRFRYRGITTTRHAPVYSFTKELENFRPPTNTVEKYNILLYGIAGATKSSFANSIFTLLNSNYSLVTKAIVGGSNDHTTRSLARYNDECLARFHFALWDTWGLTPLTYQSQELEEILEGRLPVNWKMNASQKDREILRQGEATRHQRKIHSVLFFLPHGSLDSKEELDLIKENYHKIMYKCPNPLVVLTKVDELIEAPSFDIWSNDSRIAQLRKKAADALKVPYNQILIGKNYTVENEKVFSIDKNNFYILHRALQNASYNIASNNSNEFQW